MLYRSYGSCFISSMLASVAAVGAVARDAQAQFVASAEGDWRDMTAGEGVPGTPPMLLVQTQAEGILLLPTIRCTVRRGACHAEATQ